MDKVYIVFQGEYLEGQSLQGVYASLPAAQAMVDELIAEAAAEEGFEYRLVEPLEWANHGYFIRIEDHKVG